MLHAGYDDLVTFKQRLMSQRPLKLFIRERLTESITLVVIASFFIDGFSPPPSIACIVRANCRKDSRIDSPIIIIKIAMIFLRLPQHSPDEIKEIREPVHTT
jgi:hypothetical protein